MARVTLPKVPSALKPPSPSTIAPGSRGPKRIKSQPIQPTREDFEKSAWKRRNPRGSYIEYLAQWALIAKHKMKPGSDFIEQFDLGSTSIGPIGGLSAVIDIVITNRFPMLGLPVMGEYWHPAFGRKLQYDLAQMQRIRIEKGWDIVPLDESDLLRDAAFVTGQALRGIDMSRYRGRV